MTYVIVKPRMRTVTVRRVHASSRVVHLQRVDIGDHDPDWPRNTHCGPMTATSPATSGPLCKMCERLLTRCRDGGITVVIL